MGYGPVFQEAGTRAGRAILQAARKEGDGKLSEDEKMHDALAALKRATDGRPDLGVIVFVMISPGEFRMVTNVREEVLDDLMQARSKIRLPNTH
jgi:hypothetical protein